MSNYLTHEKRLKGFTTNFTLDYQLMSSAAYDDEEIRRTILSKNQDECYIVGLHFAICGQGGGVISGSCVIENQPVDIVTLCDRNEIKYNNEANSKLDVSTLTPRRLSRFFCEEIYCYIETNQQNSFLASKYLASEVVMPGVFPGAEFLRQNHNEAELIRAYKVLDEVFNTKFSRKIELTIRQVKIRSRVKEIQGKHIESSKKLKDGKVQEKEEE
jgi:hypothetical protein